MDLGVFYHAAFPFAPDKLWLTRFDVTEPWFTYLIVFIHTFRMSAFFLISGFLASMVIEKYGTRRFLRKRSRRLLVPWMATSILVCEPIIRFVTGELSLSTATRSYLWFIPVLFLLAILHATLLGRTGLERIQRLTMRRSPLSHVPGILAVVIGASVINLVWMRVAWRLPLEQISSASFGFVDFEQLAEFVVYYFAGALLYFYRRHLETLMHGWPLYAALSASYFALAFLLPDRVNEYILELLKYATGFAMTFLAFSLFRSAGPGRLYRPWVGNFSYTLYLFHVPLIWILLLPLQRVVSDPAVAFLVLSTTTMALCAGIHAVVMRSRMLSFLFNGELAGRSRTSPTGLTQSPARQ